MTIAKVLALLAVAAVALLVLATAVAQDQPPQRFVGTALIDGQPVPDGTAVVALIDGATVASTTTSGGRYRLDVVQPAGASFAGKAVTFTVGGLAADQSAIWTFGELTALDLTALSSNVPPQRFAGTALIDGQPVPDGTVVAARIEGQTVASTTTAGGRYRLDVVQPLGASFAGRAITFTVGGFAADQSAAWTFGELTELNLTALSPSVPPQRFIGTALIDGQPIPDGTAVAALIDGAAVASITTSGSRYRLDVVQAAGASFAGKAVTFAVGGLAADQSATWTVGGVTELNLTALSPSVPPQRFVGTALIDGQPVPDGTVVVALVDGATVASTPTSGVRYRLDVLQLAGASFAGKAVTFTVGGLIADQSATWAVGGVTELALAAFSPNVPPQRFAGTAVIDGVNLADGTTVAAVIDGRRVATATASGGQYRLDVVQAAGTSFAGRAVTFTLGGVAADQSATWSVGEVTELNLTGFVQGSPPHRFGGTVTINSVSAPDGTAVTAVIDGQTVVSATTSGGRYRLDAIQPRGASFAGKSATFTVGGITATPSATWTLGEVTELNLTVSTQAPPSITINPNNGPVGTSVAVTGAGFGANETGITVTYDGATVASGITANAQGAWTATFTVPASAGGSHTIAATRATQPGVPVDPKPFTAISSISLNRASGPPGAALTLTGAGFAAAEPGITVTYDGAPVASGIAANAQGSWTATFAVPASPAGPHTITASGTSTPATSVIFTVTLSGGAIQGRVFLQGNTNHAGIVVGLLGGSSTTTDNEGNFTLSNLSPGSYTIGASARGFLPAIKAGVVVVAGQTTTVSNVTLRAGDLDNNGIIDIRDLALLARNLGTTESPW